MLLKHRTLPARTTGGLCRPTGEVLSRIGERWSVPIVMSLGDGPSRFNEIKRVIGGIAQRMSSLTLRGSERDGLITWIVTPTVPPRVDCGLTNLDRSLWTPLAAVGP